MGVGGTINAYMNRDGIISAFKKNFEIPSPLDPEGTTLVHAVVEGPEYAVYYRGTAQLVDGEAVVELPNYFEALTRPEGRTVQVTPRLADTGPIALLAASDVRDGSFRVRAVTADNPEQSFFWEVKAVRSDVEPLEVERPRDTASEHVAAAADDRPDQL